MTVQIDPGTHLPVQPKKKSSKLIWILILIGLLFVCCVFVVIIASLSSNQKSTSVIQTDVAQVITPENTQVETVGTPTAEPIIEPTATEPAISEVVPPTTKQDIYMVGEQANASGIAITILNVQKIKSLQLFTADAGNVFLDIEVLIENIDHDETTPYNSLYFKVKDDTAAEYTTTLATVDPSLKSGELAKGDKARGHVTFEIPENSTGLVVSYEPMVLFGGYETIRINLEETADTPLQLPVREITEDQVGGRFESAGIAITVLSVTPNASMGLQPSAGQMYLDIEVLLENVSRDENAPYNPLYFKIKDAQYMEYNTAFMSLDPSLTSGDLVKGDKVRGHVAFGVPAEMKKFVVSYEPEVLFGGYEPIEVNIVLP